MFSFGTHTLWLRQDHAPAGKEGTDDGSALAGPKVSRASYPLALHHCLAEPSPSGWYRMRTPSALRHTSVSDWLWVLVSHQGLCLPESEPERQAGIPALERGRDLCFQPNKHWITFLCLALCWGLLHGISLNLRCIHPFAFVYPTIIYPSTLLFIIHPSVYPSIQLSIHSSTQPFLHPFVHASNNSTLGVYRVPLNGTWSN